MKQYLHWSDKSIHLITAPIANIPLFNLSSREKSAILKAFDILLRKQIELELEHHEKLLKFVTSWPEDKK